MRISSKGRYAVASMVYLAQRYKAETNESVLDISTNLGISKIYLEQVFSLLKNAGLVISVKGAGGGYRLAQIPEDIQLITILAAVEFSLFEKTQPSASDDALAIEQAIQNHLWRVLDVQLERTLSEITLANLAREAENYATDEHYMFFI